MTVTQLKANSATVSWDVPEGDVVIGYAILQQVSSICPRGLGALITGMLLCQSFCRTPGLLWHLPEDISAAEQPLPGSPM